MNYYKRFPGDYMRDTSHLSLAEHGAYTVLLDHYYSTQRALPAPLEALCRLCRATTKPERLAVQSVVDQFFPLAEDGLRHNDRADREIAKWEGKAVTNRTVGKLGGRPKKEPTGNPPENPQETQTVSKMEPTGNPLQKPEARNQKGEKTGDPRAGAREPSPVGRVFEHWRRVWGHPGAKLDAKRRKRIEARLAEFSAEQLCDAISGFRHSPWHCGTDPKGNGTVYDGLDTLLRDTEQVEKGLRFFAHPPRPPPRPETVHERMRRLNGGDEDYGRTIDVQPDEPSESALDAPLRIVRL